MADAGDSFNISDQIEGQPNVEHLAPAVPDESELEPGAPVSEAEVDAKSAVSPSNASASAVAKIPLKRKDNDRPLSKQEIYDKLLVYQAPHVEILMNALSMYDAALDGSDPGVGKTYCACAIAALLNLVILVVCPFSVVGTWRRIAEMFHVKIHTVVNYELLRIGRDYDAHGHKRTSPYLKVINKGEDFQWELPPDTLLVLDEAHKCKNLERQLARMMIAAKSKIGASVKMLMLSATAADKPQYFGPFAYMLGLCDSVRIFSIYLKSLHQLNPMNSVMISLHRKVFPARGARLRRIDLGDLFPKNKVIAELITMGDDIEKQIEAQYELLAVAVKDLKKKEECALHPLERMLRARQKIEALKVQCFVELARDDHENGLSSVIFLNFRDTLNLLANKLKTDCLIYGGQTMAEREHCINRFQSNQDTLIIAQIQSGGYAISLHDIHGPDENHPNGHPRSAIISPPNSAQDLVQALGRIVRANGKTHCLQRIIFCANTVEEQICAALQTKLDTYAQINDGEEKSSLRLVQDK